MTVDNKALTGGRPVRGAGRAALARDNRAGANRDGDDPAEGISIAEAVHRPVSNELQVRVAPMEQLRVKPLL